MVNSLVLIPLGIMAILLLIPTFFYPTEIDEFNVAGTTVYSPECVVDGDCSNYEYDCQTGLSTCAGGSGVYYCEKTGNCTDNTCGLTAEWSFANCTISEALCGADCDSDQMCEDKELGQVCEDCACV